MRIDIVTLFPEMCENILNESIIGRARARGYLQVCCQQLRDHGEGVHKRFRAHADGENERGG